MLWACCHLTGPYIPGYLFKKHGEAHWLASMGTGGGDTGANYRANCSRGWSESGRKKIRSRVRGLAFENFVLAETILLRLRGRAQNVTRTLCGTIRGLGAPL